MITNTIKLGFSGEYKLVINKPNGEIYETDWMKNVITDIGLDYIGNPTAQFTYDRIPYYFRLGTGTSPPLPINTKLDNQIAWAENQFNFGVSSSRNGYTYTSTWRYNFAQGAVVGNITEMGVGWESSNTGNSLFSRALILDSSGNPTTLTLTSIDQLTAYYRCSMIAPTNDIVGNFQINSITYNYIGRAFNLSSDGWGSNKPNSNIWRLSFAAGGNALTGLVPIDGSFPPNVNDIFAWADYSDYIPGSKYRNFTLNVPVGGGNFSAGDPPVIGIKTLFITTSGGTNWQYEFNPPIPKVNTQVLTMAFRVSWDRQ